MCKKCNAMYLKSIFLLNNGWEIFGNKSIILNSKKNK